MKDLIEILAARATGLEVALAPMVGSLYDPDSAIDWEQTRLEEVLTQVVAPRLGSAATHPVAAPITRRAWAPVDAATQPASAPAGEAPALAEPNSPKPRTSFPVVASRLVSRTNEGSTPDAGPAMVPGSTTRLREPAVSATSSSTPDSAVGQALPVPTRASSQATPAGQAKSSPSAFDSSAPRRAVAAGLARRDLRGPRLNAFSEQAPVRPALARGAGGSTDATDNAMDTVGETIVNVTIGRVELRAVRQAAAVQPTQVSAPKPFPSLEEYLERTSEGRA